MSVVCCLLLAVTWQLSVVSHQLSVVFRQSSVSGGGVIKRWCRSVAVSRCHSRVSDSQRSKVCDGTLAPVFNL